MGATRAQRRRLERSWGTWVVCLFPTYARAPFAAHHRRFWDWVWAIAARMRPRPFVAIWSRGHAKSTSAELAVVAMGARGARRFCLYVCETQKQADDHVAAIAGMLHQPLFAAFYPEHADRALSKYGHSKGWKRNRLRTRGGFTVDALGLDTASRGVKIDDVRPDLIVFDDIDNEADTVATTDKKLHMITRRILPTRDKHCAVLAVQNLISTEGIFGALCGRAEWKADLLHDRIVSGPIPAIEGFTWESLADGGYRITGGEPTWPGKMDLPACEDEMLTLGLSGFLAECQHEPEGVLGGMFDHLEFKHVDPGMHVPLVRTTVWVDPAVSDTDHSDRYAIQADGLGEDDRIYRMFSWEQRSTPETALELAIETAFDIGSLEVGVETDQGGDTWQTVYEVALESVLRKRHDLAAAVKIGRKFEPRFVWDKAGRGYGSKVHRAQQMLTDYENGRIVHYRGTHVTLERALRRFPKVKPFDLVDAAFWSWNWLRNGQQGEPREMRDRRLAGRR